MGEFLVERFDIDKDGTITAVEIATVNADRAGLPVDYALPAGFQGHVRLDVYDVRGARVAHLLDEPGRPGRYDVVWRLQDDAGQRVSTGVYFLRLDAGPFAETRKVVVLR